MTTTGLAGSELTLDLQDLVERARRNPENEGARQAAIEALRSASAELDRSRDPRVAQFLADISPDAPRPVLTAAGQGGAVLSAGTVCILTGEGGVAKTGLSLAVAVGMASREPLQQANIGQGIFDAWGGKVLMATWEDQPGWTAWRARALASHLDHGNSDGAAHSALRSSVQLLDLAGRPLYGPAEGTSYSSRPVPLPGWVDLQEATASLQPNLIIIDPALAAFVGESNAASPVREFLGGLAELGKQHDAGVLLLAHSTKAARGARQNPEAIFDPGLVGGSGHWTDGARGVITLTRTDEGGYLLAVAKANYGPSRLKLSLRPVRAAGQQDQHSGAITGFEGLGKWEDSSESGGQTYDPGI